MTNLNSFEAYTWQHSAPLLAAAGLCAVLILLGRGKSLTWKHRLGFYVSLIIPLMITRDLVLQLLQGSLDLAEDLPLHLCRIVCYFLPIAFWKQSPRWFGVLYFLILAGTVQALITPDLAEGFPHYQYFRYWILHAGLVSLIIYALIISKMRLTFKDFWRAVLFAQIYLVSTFPINALLDANYGYTCYKPPVASLADMMGPWPWYILTGEAIMFALFLLLMTPFFRRRKAI